MKNCIQHQLPSFKFVKSYYDPHGYWGAFFSDNYKTIFIGSERSFVDYSLEINGNKIALAEFDDRVMELKNTSTKNIIFLIDTIKKYLEKYI